jgi:hypothetical protein
MNNKTAKLIKKHAELKGINPKQAKREWLSLNEFQKDAKRQEVISTLAKK